MSLADPLMLPDAQPQTLGRYQLLRPLGGGGMGTVYLARLGGAGGFSKQVALKVIRPAYEEWEEIREMFCDEAQIASRIEHPNVCSVIDFGEDAGSLFLAMELLRGRSLDRLVRTLGRRPELRSDARFLPLALRIASEAAEGLHAAHHATDEDGCPLEVVHRDVSPENIFLTWQGGVRITDFGISRATGRRHRTATGVFKGKIPYASPESFYGGPLDARSDLWSLGVVLFELATGVHPFLRGSDASTMHAVLREQIPAPSDCVKNLPRELDRILETMLQRNPERRYPTAGDLSHALRCLAWTLGAPFSAAEQRHWMKSLFAEGAGPEGPAAPARFAHKGSLHRGVPTVPHDVPRSPSDSSLFDPSSVDQQATLESRPEDVSLVDVPVGRPEHFDEQPTLTKRPPANQVSPIAPPSDLDEVLKAALSPSNLRATQEVEPSPLEASNTRRELQSHLVPVDDRSPTLSIPNVADHGVHDRGKTGRYLPPSCRTDESSDELSLDMPDLQLDEENEATIQERGPAAPFIDRGGSRIGVPASDGADRRGLAPPQVNLEPQSGDEDLGSSETPPPVEVPQVETQSGEERAQVALESTEHVPRAVFTPQPTKSPLWLRVWAALVSAAAVVTVAVFLVHLYSQEPAPAAAAPLSDAEIGTLRIRTLSGDRAQVFRLDGSGSGRLIDLGRTPLFTELPPGRHELNIHHDSGEEEHRSVEIAAGAEQILALP